MAQLHLPVEHSAEDLAIAGALAERLEAAELYVTWSECGGPARPSVCAAIRGRRTTARRRRPRLAALLDSLRGRAAQP